MSFSSICVIAFCPVEVTDHFNTLGATAPEGHITLAYAGKVEDVGTDSLEEDLVASLSHISAMLPVKVTLGEHLGLFDNQSTGGDRVCWASVSNSSALSALRAAVVAGVAKHVQVDDTRFDSGWKPHYTLAYLDTDEDCPVKEPSPIEFTIKELTLCYGDKRTVVS